MADFSQVREQLTVAVERICDDGANLLMRDIAATDAPIGLTGELSRDWDVVTTTAGNGAVSHASFNAEHASYQQDGSGPHLIEGNPYLAFDGGFGQTVIVRRVNHPGSTVNRGWADKLKSESDWAQACQAALDSYSFS